MKRFNLHVRVTKNCGADCSYCSSWQENPDDRLNSGNAKNAFNYISEYVLPLLGMTEKADLIEIQYVGGEILNTPLSDLESIVWQGRETFLKKFHEVIDGAQSNLISNNRRVLWLHRLFQGRIATSTDHFTNQRTVAGSSERYKKILSERLQILKKRKNVIPPAVFVTDKKGLQFLHQEIDIAEKNNRSLTIRPVFEGGKDAELPNPTEIANEWQKAFINWVGRSTIVIEPFGRLLALRLAAILQNDQLRTMHSACPFQANCAWVSLDLEPNGDLYLCYEMADSGRLKLGNALEEYFDHTTWEEISQRSQIRNPECRKCKWVTECQGGCLNEALANGGDIHSRSPLCYVWKTLFAEIDKSIENYGAEFLRSWLEDISQ